MIYNQNYLAKELGYISGVKNNSIKNAITSGIFLGVLAFSVHFTLQILRESIMYQAFPQIMQSSYYSVLYVYNIIAVIYEIVYLYVGYKHLTFYEISENKWYAMLKMGHSYKKLTNSKIAAAVIKSVVRFIMGFITCVLITTTLKYTFILGYMPTMMIKGVADIILTVVISLTLSLFIENISEKGLTFVLSLSALIILYNVTNFLSIYNNRVEMQSLKILYNNYYFLLNLIIIIICVIICNIKIKKISKKIYIKNNNEISQIVGKLESTKKLNNPAERAFATFKNILIVICATSITLGIFVNIFILLISVNSQSKEPIFGSFIPYIFHTTTMEPELSKNDLVIFEEITNLDNIKQGEIIIYKDNDTTRVARIMQRNNNNVVVDIDNYPELAQPNAMRKTVDINEIYGIYTYKSRWLGALILFANSFIGRLLMLILPTIVIFYRNQIFKKYKETESREY